MSLVEKVSDVGVPLFISAAVVFDFGEGSLAQLYSMSESPAQFEALVASVRSVSILPHAQGRAAPIAAWSLSGWSRTQEAARVIRTFDVR